MLYQSALIEKASFQPLSMDFSGFTIRKKPTSYIPTLSWMRSNTVCMLLLLGKPYLHAWLVQIYYVLAAIGVGIC